MSQPEKQDTPELTPITQQPIGQVHSDQWKDMPISELWEQHSILNTRLNYALQMRHAEMIKQLQIGLDVIDQVIQAKGSVNDTRLV